MTTAFVTAVSLDLLPQNLERIAAEAARFAENAAPRIAGLIEIAVLRNDEHTRLLLLSRWESKDAWAQSRWDRDVGEMMVALVESANTVDLQTFVPIADDLKRS